MRRIGARDGGKKRASAGGGSDDDRGKRRGGGAAAGGAGGKVHPEKAKWLAHAFEYAEERELKGQVWTTKTVTRCKYCQNSAKPWCVIMSRPGPGPGRTIPTLTSPTRARRQAVYNMTRMSDHLGRTCTGIPEDSEIRQLFRPGGVFETRKYARRDDGPGGVGTPSPSSSSSSSSSSFTSLPTTPYGSGAYYPDDEPSTPAPVDAYGAGPEEPETSAEEFLAMGLPMALDLGGGTAESAEPPADDPNSSLDAELSRTIEDELARTIAVELRIPTTSPRDRLLRAALARLGADDAPGGDLRDLYRRLELALDLSEGVERRYVLRTALDRIDDVRGQA